MDTFSIEVEDKIVKVLQFPRPVYFIHFEFLKFGSITKLMRLEKGKKTVIKIETNDLNQSILYSINTNNHDAPISLNGWKESEEEEFFINKSKAIKELS